MQEMIKNNKINKEKNIVKKQTGITLIALVITIIILLILAGVSIAMLTGNNGILTQAKLAKENTELAKEDEENKLADTNEYINEQLGNAVSGEIVLETKKDNYVDSNGDKATIPAGFTVSKITEEQKVSEGLVIYDIPKSEVSNVDWDTAATKYNQFVWIPVANAEKYQRDFTYPSYYYLNNAWVLSESTPENSTTTDVGYLPTDIQPTTDDAKNNETAERKAVLKYNGFYIARYEAGEEDSNVVSKQNSTVYVSETQESFKAIGKTMYRDSSAYVKSEMCSGTQWDMVMKFVDGKTDGNGSIYDVRTYNPDRRTGNRAKTGENLADKVQNIYDLEGNCYEYVAEKNNTSYPIVFRGAFCNNDSSYRASIRSSNYGDASSYFTFRSALYIK